MFQLLNELVSMEKKMIINRNRAALAAGALAFATGVSASEAESDVNSLEGLLSAYETALNASDTATIISLYTVDGVFMPQHRPSQIGTAAVQAAYRHVFDTIKLNIEFQVEEIVQISPEWAFARTNSVGTVTVLAAGITAPEANQELFVLHKDEGGRWKIARYAFSTTTPPRDQ